MTSRLKVAYFDFRYWFIQVLAGRPVRICNLPPDTKVEHAFVSEQRWHREIGVHLSSASFDELPEGGLIPELNILFKDTTPLCSTCRHATRHEEDGVTVCNRGVWWKGDNDIEPDAPLPYGFGCVLHETKADV